MSDTEIVNQRLFALLSNNALFSKFIHIPLENDPILKEWYQNKIAEIRTIEEISTLPKVGEKKTYQFKGSTITEYDANLIAQISLTAICNLVGEVICVKGAPQCLPECYFNPGFNGTTKVFGVDSHGNIFCSILKIGDTYKVTKCDSTLGLKEYKDAFWWQKST